MDGISALKKIDKRQLWRLFIDGKFHNKYGGWVGYEQQENGSTQGMINAYTFMLENFDLSKGISCHYLRKLHLACMFHVRASVKESTPGDLRFHRTGFKLFDGRTTIEFLKELIEVRKHDSRKVFDVEELNKPTKELDPLEIYQVLKRKKVLRYKPWFPQLNREQRRGFNQEGSLVDFYEAKFFVQLQFAKKMEEIVNKFNNKLQQLEGEDNIINSIAKFVQELQLVHPFPDGNCRTFLTLTNHLLLYKGLYPTMIKDPNYDASYGSREYAYEIKKGIQCTKQLLENPSADVYDYSINNMENNDIEHFLEMGSKLIQKIDSFFYLKPSFVNNPIYLTPEILTKITKGKWINYNPNISYAGVGKNNEGAIEKNYISFFVSLSDWRRKKVPYDTIMQKIKNTIKKQGVTTIVVDREEYAKDIEVPVLIVDDVVAMLRKVAVEVRQKVNPKAVYIGGTVGKTGFKVQLYNCLKNIVNTHAIINSANISLPIFVSLANLKKNDKVEIVEVSGATNYGLVLSRSKIISPNLCVLTNISLAHMNIHKSLENLIKVKASAVEGLEKNGTCIVYNDAVYAKELIEYIKKIREDVKIITFGESNENDAYIVSKEFNSNDFSWDINAEINQKTIEYNIPLFQSHAPTQSTGVLLAIDSLGYDINAAALNYKNISTFETMGRLFRISDKEKSFIFYDQSLRGSIQGMKSALNDLKNFKIVGKKIALLGGSSIDEDGEFTKMQHEELAQFINDSDIDILYTTGPYLNYMYDNLSDEFKSKLIMHSDDRELLLKEISKRIEDGDCVFVMGSNYLRLGDIGKKIAALGEKKQLR